MIYILLFVIFIISYIEIIFFIEITYIFGIFITLLLMITTSFIGLSLIQKQKIQILCQIKNDLINGKFQTSEIIKNIFILIAGFLLFLPGFFTDFISLIFLLSSVQNLFIKYITSKLYFKYNNNYKSSGEIFEGEYYRHDVNKDKQNNKKNYDK